MDKFYEVSEDAIARFYEVFNKKSFPVSIKFQFVGCEKQKELIKVSKIPDHFAFVLQKEILVSINDDLVSVFDDESITILMEQEIDKINVPDASTLAKKLYYPIGEVAGWFNVNTSLIRYWEKEFKQLQPRKTRKGDRLFRAQDIEFLKQIYYLLREKKYSIDGAKTYLKNNKEKATKDLALLNSLQHLKTFLASLKSSL